MCSFIYFIYIYFFWEEKEEEGTEIPLLTIFLQINYAVIKQHSSLSCISIFRLSRVSNISWIMKKWQESLWAIDEFNHGRLTLWFEIFHKETIALDFIEFFFFERNFYAAFFWMSRKKNRTRLSIFFFLNKWIIVIYCFGKLNWLSVGMCVFYCNCHNFFFEWESRFSA